MRVLQLGGQPWAVGFAALPDELRLVASGDGQASVALWDPSTGQHLRTLAGHGDRVVSVAFTTMPDNTPLLATGSHDHTVRLWDPSTGQHLRTLTGHHGRVVSIAFITEPDSTPLLASAGLDGTVLFWDADRGDPVESWTGPVESSTSLAVASLPDGTPLVASAGPDGTIQLRAKAAGEHVRSLSGHTDAVDSLVFTTLPDGTVLLGSASRDHTARLWNVHDGQCVSVLDHPGQALAIGLRAGDDGRVLTITGCSDGKVRLWDLLAEPANGADDNLATRLVSHTGIVESVAFTTLPDGAPILASAGHDATIRLWNPATGMYVRTLTGHTGTVDFIASTTLPDGTPLLASASHDTTVRLWNLATGALLRTLSGHSLPVLCVAFGTPSDGASLLASGSEDGEIRLWDPATGAHLRSLSGHTSSVHSVAMTILPDGTPLLASGSRDATIRLWNPESGAHLRTLTDHTDNVGFATFVQLPDGQIRLVTSSWDHTIRVWDPVTGRCLRTLAGHSHRVFRLAHIARPDGTVLLASPSRDRTIRLWNLATGECLRTITGHTRSVYSVAFATLADGTLLMASGSRDRTVRLWEPATGEHLHTFTDPAISEPRTSPEERSHGRLSGEASPQVEWSIDGTHSRTNLAGHTDNMYSALFINHPGSAHLLASTSVDHTVRLWDRTTGEHVGTLAGHSGGVTAIACLVLADGTPLLASASRDRTICVWNSATGVHLRTLTGHSSGVYSVAIAMLPDGTPLLASAGQDKTVRLWDPVSGAHLRTLTGHTGAVYSVALTTLADGTPLLASCGEDNVVRMWDPVTGAHLRTLTDHAHAVYSVAFTALADGTPLLASGGYDETIRLWDPVTGEHLRTMTGHTDAVYSVVFATLPDGTPLLASASTDQTIRLWHPTAGHLHTIEANLLISTHLPEIGMVIADGDRLLVAYQDGHDVAVSTLRIRPGVKLRNEPPSAVPHLAASVNGLVALNGADIHPPLSLVAELVDLTARTPRLHGNVAALGAHHGVQRLRDLNWPPAARIGLAALLLDQLSFDPRYRAPAIPPAPLLTALRDALASPPTPAARIDVPFSALQAAAGHITDGIVSLLTILGADAVAADPILPLRLRHFADQLPPLDTRTGSAHVETLRLMRGAARTRGLSNSAATGAQGVGSGGVVTNLLLTQLALPADIFTIRLIRDELLYRLRNVPANRPFDRLTIVLDTTPPTFGPIESVLRLIAHSLTTALWLTHRHAELMYLDDPKHVVPLVRPADLMAIWTHRTLQPPALGAVLDTASRRSAPSTVILTHHHLAREHPLFATPTMRILTTNAPDDPPQRSVASPHHIHVPARPTGIQVARAVAKIIAPAGTRH